MNNPRIGRVALFAAPLVAVAAVPALLLATAQTPQVLAWGGLATLLCAAPIAVPERHRRTAIGVCAVLLLGAVALSVLSIGVYFVPALAVLVVAGLAPRPDRR